MGKPTQQQIAQKLGISNGRVSQLKAQGMPIDSVEAARTWYDEHVDQRLSPKLIPGIQLPSRERLTEIVENAYDIQQARAKRETHEANLAELKERQALGELVEVKRVTLAVTSLTATTRAAFERIPDKLAERLAAMTDPHAIHLLLTQEIDQVLTDLVAGGALMTFTDDGHGRS